MRTQPAAGITCGTADLGRRGAWWGIDGQAFVRGRREPSRNGVKPATAPPRADPSRLPGANPKRPQTAIAGAHPNGTGDLSQEPTASRRASSPTL